MSQANETCKRLAALDAREAHLTDELRCLTAEAGFLGAEVQRLFEMSLHERVPLHVTAGLMQAIYLIRDSHSRMESDAEVIRNLMEDSRAERAVLDSELTEQTVAFLDCEHEWAETLGKGVDEPRLNVRARLWFKVSHPLLNNISF